MKFLFKYPTRSRPELFKKVIREYLVNLSGKHEYEFVISVDEDDTTMEKAFTWVTELPRLPKGNLVINVCKGKNKNKVEAINADLKDRSFDILFLISDDMHPVVPGFDDVIAKDMMKHFPALDGALHYHCNWWNNDKLIVLSIMGKRLYDHFKYIYHPDYQSESCDQEFTDVVYEMNKVTYIPNIIVEHRWIGATKPDSLNNRNIELGYKDAKTYRERKAKGFPK